MKASITLLTLFLVLSGGCASTGSLSSEMADWQGEDVGVALAAWGEPEAERAFGSQTILIWRDRSAFVAGPNGVVCERMLAVAVDGEITGWRWRGDACPSIASAERYRHMAATP